MFGLRDLTLVTICIVIGWTLRSFIEVEVRFRGRPPCKRCRRIRRRDVSVGTSVGGCSENGRVDLGSATEKLKPLDKKQKPKKKSESWIQRKKRQGKAFNCDKCGRLTAIGDRSHKCEHGASSAVMAVQCYPEFPVEKVKQLKELPVEKGIQAKAIWLYGEAQTDWSMLKPPEDMKLDDVIQAQLWGMAEAERYRPVVQAINTLLEARGG
jgi:hypothetical protein